MELTQIRYFLELANTCHVTKTAERLHIAQPALTQSVRRLEKTLGVPLFETSGRNIKLTPYGVYLKDKLSKILQEFDSIPEELEKLRGNENNTIRISARAASYTVAKMLTRYKKQNPDIIFKMSQGDNDADADIIISTETFSKNINQKGRREIITERIFLAVPIDSPFSARKSISLEEVKNEDFICLMGSKQLRYICDKFCQQSGFVPKVVFESDNLAAVKNMISANIGVGFWPEFSWGRLDGENAVLLEISSPECKRNIVISEKEDCSPAVQSFFDYLGNSFKDFTH
ncbi:MAG: LysR family transcriptional regulator [Clostridia bacterium]|nr:LysR family transcriptional regulator [Clostridia bacterium]